MVASAVWAESAKEEIYANLNLAGNQYYAYPAPDSTHYSKPPKGYTPFYISTYQRHGSRFLIGESDYTKPQYVLHKADSLGLLTKKGKEVKFIVDSVSAIAKERYGELTPLGFRQHEGIARRMYRNFPEIFKGKKHIDARSTVVIRCILSMMSECYTLKGLNPKLTITTDASYADLYYLNNGASNRPSPYHSIEKDKELHKSLEEAKATLFTPERLINELFTEYTDSVMGLSDRNFMSMLYEIAISLQNIDTNLTLLPYFTPEECYNGWRYSNFFWHNNSGFSPLTKNAKPYAHEALLRNLIDTADTIIYRGGDAATLRFGHDGILLPLAALMHIDNCAYSTADIDELTEKWRAYTMFPMASNLQVIFFKGKKSTSPVLIKIMLNEKECRLPIENYDGPFYEWERVKDYWLNTVLANIPII